MNRDIYLNEIKRLNAIGEDERMHILDRVDAYLELAQLIQRDVQQAWTAVRKARDLIWNEFRSRNC